MEVVEADCDGRFWTAERVRMPQYGRMYPFVIFESLYSKPLKAGKDSKKYILEQFSARKRNSLRAESNRGPPDDNVQLQSDALIQLSYKGGIADSNLLFAYVSVCTFIPTNIFYSPSINEC